MIEFTEELYEEFLVDCGDLFINPDQYPIQAKFQLLSFMFRKGYLND